MLAPPARSACNSTVVAEYRLNRYESFVAELTTRADGRRVASIARIKCSASGSRRKAVFEFGERRAVVIASLIDELLRAIAARPTAQAE